MTSKEKGNIKHSTEEQRRIVNLHICSLTMLILTAGENISCPIKPRCDREVCGEPVERKNINNVCLRNK